MEAPLKRMTIYHTGDAGWIALCWRPERPHMTQAHGPFRTQTDATKWARQHYPRCYRIGRMSTPRDHERGVAWDAS